MPCRSCPRSPAHRDQLWLRPAGPPALGPCTCRQPCSNATLGWASPRLVRGCSCASLTWPRHAQPHALHSATSPAARLLTVPRLGHGPNAEKRSLRAPSRARGVQSQSPQKEAWSPEATALQSGDGHPVALLLLVHTAGTCSGATPLPGSASTSSAGRGRRATEACPLPAGRLQPAVQASAPAHWPVWRGGWPGDRP